MYANVKRGIDLHVLTYKYLRNDKHLYWNMAYQSNIQLNFILFYNLYLQCMILQIIIFEVDIKHETIFGSM